MSARYACRFVADRRSVSLVELSAGETERTVRVTAGTGSGWEIALSIWYLPSVAIIGDTVAVWAATRLFILTLGHEATRADFDDEVHAVYAVDAKLCIVGELTVFVYDPDRRAIVDRFQADDVLGTSWWEEGRLFVESASGKPLAFDPSADAVNPVAAL